MVQSDPRLLAKSLERREEPHVVVVEHPDIRNAMPEHRDALDADAEGEARVPLRVVADMLEHVRIDHASAEDLHPAVAPRDVNLDARLGERKEARAQADLAVGAEELLRQMVERALEVRERDALVDQEPFDLLEVRGVRGVLRVAAVDAARADDCHRRLLALHHPHLHRGGVGA